MELPEGHKIGMKVPLGGSMCKNCEYVNGTICTNKDFIKWNDSGKIPAPINRYCCDFYGIMKKNFTVKEKISKYKS